MTNPEKAAHSPIDELLLDAGHADAPELRAYLLGLRSLADVPLPAPGAELASLLAGSVDELARKRPLRKHRPTVVSVAVIAGMGLGVSGVAATSPNPTLQGVVYIQNLDGGWSPGWEARSDGTSVPLSAAPASPGQPFEGHSSANPHSGPSAAEAAGDAPSGWTEGAQLNGSAPAGGSQTLRGGSAEASDGANNGTGLAAVKEPRRSGRHVASTAPVEKGLGTKAWASDEADTDQAGYPDAGEASGAESPGTMLQRAGVQAVPFWEASLDLPDLPGADVQAPAQLDIALPDAPELDALPDTAEPVATPQSAGKHAAPEPVATPQSAGKPVAAPELVATPQGAGKHAAAGPAALQSGGKHAATEPAAQPQGALPAPAQSALPAAPPAAVVPAQDKSVKKSAGSAPGVLPSGRHFSQTAPPQSVASAADSVGSWLKNHRR